MLIECLENARHCSNHVLNINNTFIPHNDHVKWKQLVVQLYR